MAEDIEVKTENNVDDIKALMPIVIEPKKSKSPYKDVKGKEVKITQLVPFDKHPFNIPSENDPDMQKLKSSIEQEGLLNLPIVRKLNKEHEEDEEKYQIISGHRRVKACELLGWDKIPVRIVDITDNDVATLVMINSNVQRKKINFIEQVRACSMMYEAKKHQGQNKGEEEKSTRKYVGKIWKFSQYKVQKLVDLSKLSDYFLNLIANKKITSAVGIEISKMPKEKQDLIEAILSENEDLRITQKQAQEIGETTEELTRDKILELLQNNDIQEDTQTDETTQSDNQGININFSINELRQYFPEIEDITEENIKSIILERLGLQTN